MRIKNSSTGIHLRMINLALPFIFEELIIECLRYVQELYSRPFGDNYPCLIR